MADGLDMVADKEAGGRSLCRKPWCLGVVATLVLIGISLVWWLAADQGTPEPSAQRASIMLPGSTNSETPASAAPKELGAAQPLPGLDVMAGKLAKRLQREPADGEGWALLARTYLELGKTAEADAAYARAIALRPDELP